MTTRKSRSTPSGAKKSGSAKKSAKLRQQRPYPAASYRDATELGTSIMKHAGGAKVRRLTLCEKLGKSETSSATRMMITNSSKYGITTGSYTAEYLELTPRGRIAVDDTTPVREKRAAEFELAIDTISPFKLLYDEYKGKRLPAREILKDTLKDSSLSVPDVDECVDTFIVNVKQLDLLRVIGGAETLVSIEHVLDELAQTGSGSPTNQPQVPQVVAASIHPPDRVEFAIRPSTSSEGTDWDRVCFYMTPMGEPGSAQRQHSDLFMGSFIQPALDELGLTVVRADHIGEAGMITSQILEYIKRAKLAIADLSFLNANVFYEMGLRHARRLPVVQIIRKADKIPFDVNQVRTIVIDTTDIYSLVPQIASYRSEIATQSRKAINDPESAGNPVSVFYPAFFA